MPKKTKAYERFLNRLGHFNADLELIDLLVSKQSLDSKTKIDNKYATLTARTFKDNGKLAKTHLKTTICGSYIKDIYELLTHYMQDILTATIASSNNLKIEQISQCSKNKQLTFETILGCKTYDNIIEKIGQQIFRSLEDTKSTIKIITDYNKMLGLNIDETYIKNALPFLELRHMLVHNDGKADNAFSEKYSNNFIIRQDRIQLNYDLIVKAKKEILALIEQYDIALISQNLLDQKFFNPTSK